jgi:peptide deformylase
VSLFESMRRSTYRLALEKRFSKGTHAVPPTYQGRPRRILGVDDPGLRKIAKPVGKAELRDPLFSQIIDDMFATVRSANLIGMAAPQIGIRKQLFVVHFEDEGESVGPMTVINPIFELSEGEIISEEGSPCVPGIIAGIPRATHVVCTALDRNGQKIRIDAHGLLAICIQHEMDHLQGKLIIDKALWTKDNFDKISTSTMSVSE